MSFMKIFLCPCAFPSNELVEMPLNCGNRLYTNQDAEANSFNNASPSRINDNRYKKRNPNNKEKLEVPESKRLKSNKSDLFHIEDADSDVDWEFLDSIEVQWDALQSGNKDSASDNASEISIPQNIIRYMKKVFPRKKKSSGTKKTETDIKKRDSGVKFENDPSVKLPYEEQTIGLTRTYKVEFKSINNQLLEKHGKETDRLMTRLDDLCTKKVLKKMNGIMKFKEERKKTATEHEVCPNCRGEFCLGKKHSCKVCAGVICKTCSKFLDIHIARSIRKPTSSDHTEQYEDMIHIPTISIQYNNVRGAKSDIRLCQNCYETVEVQIRKCALGDSDKNVELVSLYEKLMKLKIEASEAVETYETMCKCFADGAEIYPADMQQICRRIKVFAEKIYGLSQAISALPALPDSRQAEVHQWIRYSAIEYIQEELLTLRKLPTVEDIVKIH